MSYSSWLPTCILPSSSPAAERAVTKVSPEPRVRQVSRLFLVRELCFSYQQTLAVSKQAAAIAASGWAGGGSRWGREGMQVGRFKGAGECWGFGDL